jgi:aminoglycoside phosphotransferase (APT) family kinase protein
MQDQPLEPGSSLNPAFRTVIGTWFPACSLDDWQILGAGFGSIVLEHPVANLVCRICRTAEAARQQTAIHTVATMIPESAPFDLPHPIWQLPPQQHPDAPFGALAYRKLPGRTLDPAVSGSETIPSLVASLIHLHTRPIDTPAARLLPTWEQHEQQRRHIYREIRDTLKQQLTLQEFGTIETWQNDPAPKPQAFSLAHGDFWQENLLIDPINGRITGILDWEDAHIGDPASDFAPLRYPDPSFASRIMQDYVERTGNDRQSFETRVWWHWQNREFGGIHLSLLMRDMAELDESIEKLRHGALLSPDRHR